jgi:acyl-CoA synthetase (AMP-forming)/AMP-acid ligase II
MKLDPILQAFDHLAAHTPMAPLVISPDRRATVTAVDALARAARSHLDRSGLAPGALVGLAAPNGPGFLASLIALRRAGLAALLLDVQTPAAERGRILEALGASALLRCRSAWPDGPEDWDLATAAPPAPALLPEIAVVKLTSGSTGLPRGIATPSEALVADDAALAATMGLRPDDRILATIPMSHSYGLSSVAMPALMRGSVLVVPEEGAVFDPFTTAERTGATFFPTAPAYLDAMLRVAEAPARPATLRLVTTAGAPLSPETARRFREAFGLAVHVFYGSSETGGICYDREGGAGERGTVGTPVEGVRVTLEPPPGEETAGDEGVVTVRSPAVAAGYIPDGDPRLGEGRFRAGDVASWTADGELALRGLRDDLINIKGKKVNPREVEGVIGQLAGVEEVAVVGLPMPESSGAVLRAVVACRPGSLSAEQILSWCRPRLSAHKVPRSVLLVPEMPRTARGKLDRRALLALKGTSS